MVLGGSGVFGSGSVTRVTSLCLAGTVGLGGPDDSVRFLFALLQAARAPVQVCAPLVSWVWGTVADVGRCQRDSPSGFCAHRVRDSEVAGLSGTRVGVLAATAPGCALGPLSLPSVPLALPLLGSFSYPEV